MKKYFVVSCLFQDDDFRLTICNEDDFRLNVFSEADLERVYETVNQPDAKSVIANSIDFSELDPVGQLEDFGDIVSDSPDKMIGLILRAVKSGWGDNEEVTAKVIEELVKIKLGDQGK